MQKSVPMMIERPFIERPFFERPFDALVGVGVGAGAGVDARVHALVQALATRSVLLVLLLGIVFGWSLPAGAGDSAAEADWTAPPRALIAKTVDEVLGVLEKPDLDDAQRRAQIEAIAFSVFDFSTTSKLVLARNWKKLSKPQRVEFVEEFKQYLSRNYGSRFEGYEKTEVKVLSARVEPRRDVTVFTQVVGSQYDGITMNYRLRFRQEEWKVIDIVIEGVSMLANFRAQFSEVVSREGVDGLLEAMRSRNADALPAP
jgi:phospholipid transport system substrate-binding protein